jgi:hypothetical protein
MPAGVLTAHDVGYGYGSLASVGAMFNAVCVLVLTVLETLGKPA